MFQGEFAILREKVPPVNYIDINMYPKFKAGDTLSSHHVNSRNVLHFIFDSLPIISRALALIC
jgi:hypothetical protein